MGEDKIRVDTPHVAYEPHPGVANYPRARRKVVYKPGDVVDAKTARSHGIKTKAKAKTEAKTKTEAKAKDPDGASAGELVELGSGWYELPDGSKVQGRQNAEEALAELAAGGGGGDG
jgi:hypothetical protein